MKMPWQYLDDPIEHIVVMAYLRSHTGWQEQLDAFGCAFIANAYPDNRQYPHVLLVSEEASGARTDDHIQVYLLPENVLDKLSGNDLPLTLLLVLFVHHTDIIPPEALPFIEKALKADPVSADALKVWGNITFAREVDADAEAHAGRTSGKLVVIQHAPFSRNLLSYPPDEEEN